MKQNSRSGLIIILMTAILWPAVFGSGCFRRTHRSSTADQATIQSRNSAASVNINTASASELEALPGIGAVIAERIVAHRKQYGRFRRPEHLMMVQGISDRKFRELRPLISVE